MNSMKNMSSCHIHVDTSVESPLAMEGFQAERERERERECSYDDGHARDSATPTARTPTVKTPSSTKRSHQKLARSNERLPFSPLSNSMSNSRRRSFESNSNKHYDNSGGNTSALPTQGKENYKSPTVKKVMSNGTSLFSNSETRKRQSLEMVKEQERDECSNESSSPHDVKDSTSLSLSSKRAKHRHEELQISNENTSEAIGSVITEMETVGEPIRILNYPEHVPIPSSLFKVAFREAVKNGTHQNLLIASGCNQPSFTEVVIPTIFYAHNVQLKKMEGKALGRGQHDIRQDVIWLRCALKAAENSAIREVEELRATKAEARRLQRLEADRSRKEKERMEREEKRQQKIQIKLAQNEKKAIIKAKRKEKRRRERKTNYYKNKELWREIAGLMTDMALLEREEKMWREVNFDDKAKANSTLSPNYHASELDIAAAQFEKDNMIESDTAQNIVQSITMSANRINNVLGEVSSLMEKSETMKKELYDKYRKDHKFNGYIAEKNPKALIRAMMLK